MKKSRTHFFSWEFITGLLCIGALAIVFYFTALVSGRDLFFKSRDYPYNARFPNAGALAINDKVKILGVESGYVKKLTLSEDSSSVIVEVRIRKKINLPVDSEFTIQNSSVFGGAYVNIRPGKSRIIAPGSKVFDGFPPVDIISEASTLIAALKEDEVKLRENVLNDEFFNDVKEALKSIQRNSADFNLICRDIKEGKGSLGRLFTDASLYDDARDSFARINHLLEKVDRGEGTLGKLVADDKAYSELLSTLRDIRNMTAAVTSGKGTLGRLAGDDGRVYDSLQKSADSASRILAKIESGHGSMGKIVADEQFYNELRETVRQLRAAIEDFREMAPVATFGSIALGAL